MQHHATSEFLRSMHSSRQHKNAENKPDAWVLGNSDQKFYLPSYRQFQSQLALFMHHSPTVKKDFLFPSPVQ